MWAYNGLAYSTYYGSSGDPLKSNRNCLAYYAGGFQSHNFYSHGHIDIESYRFSGWIFPDSHLDFVNNDINDLLTLAPYFKDENPLNFDNYNSSVIKYVETDRMGNYEDTIYYPFNICKNEVAFINEIGISRMIYCTGPVKTLVIFFSKNDEENIDFTYFNIANDLVTIEAAKILGEVEKEVDNEYMKYIEFKRKNQDFYPVAWVQFPTWRLNHFEIKLTSHHQVSRILVKLIDIDNRLEEYGEPAYDPNFDILYCIFLGASFKIYQ